MRRALLVLLGFLFSSSLFAESVHWPFSNSQFLMGLTLGPTWISGNQTQTINLELDEKKTYTANSNSQTFPSGELFMGWQQPWVSHPSLMTQLGIAVAAAGNVNLNGDIWEDGDPNFDNFNYSYKVQHTHVAIKARLLGYVGSSFEPYISASAGLGFNRAYDFSITPKISQEVAPPPFHDNTTTTFVYTLGIGIQHPLNNDFQVAIGYEFSDWGHVGLSRADDQTINQGVALNHLYAHEIALSLFYS